MDMLVRPFNNFTKMRNLKRYGRSMRQRKADQATTYLFTILKAHPSWAKGSVNLRVLGSRSYK